MSPSVVYKIRFDTLYYDIVYNYLFFLEFLDRPFGDVTCVAVQHVLTFEAERVRSPERVPGDILVKVELATTVRHRIPCHKPPQLRMVIPILVIVHPRLGVQRPPRVRHRIVKRTLTQSTVRFAPSPSEAVLSTDRGVFVECGLPFYPRIVLLWRRCCPFTWFGRAFHGVPGVADVPIRRSPVWGR
ncbi:MAG: hypothetical protein R3E01_03730 [Pirellulaceae bacterium]